MINLVVACLGQDIRWKARLLLIQIHRDHIKVNRCDTL